MTRTTRIQPPPPHYLTAETGTVHQVTDRLNGYTVSEHLTTEAAETAARQLNTDPAAAIAAARALDDAQTGPAAEIRRSLRRYGYRWALVQSSAVDLHRYSELTALTEAGLLAMVWSHQGTPYYTTPERFSELSLTYVDDGGKQFPTAVASELTRRRERLLAMSDRLRYMPCEDHGIATGRCAICGPVEEWECDWGSCRANAVTRVAGQRACEQCARTALWVFGKPLPPTA